MDRNLSPVLRPLCRTHWFYTPMTFATVPSAWRYSPQSAALRPCLAISFPRMCGSSFLLHEAQIADNGKQPLSDRRFGVAGKIEKSIKFIPVGLHLR